ncbi:ribonuclease Z [Vibrio cyclitrophicus]|nr:MBL fold metallo-hydrolase [Vibrio cyclitrophicus]UPR36393.1 ribonuclease Z [Vibrio cyclitrophicus]
MPHDFKVHTLGVGDAYDGGHTNASVIVKQNEYTLLIDCGPTVPAAFFRYNISCHELDAIYITHSHPDHCLGLTTLLNWMDSKQRTRPIKIIVQREQKAVIEPLVHFAHWPVDTLGYAIEWCESETITTIGPWDAQTAPTQHAVSNLSLHLTSSLGYQLLYSGDGQLTGKSLQLACESDLVFAECETIEPHTSHGSWTQLSSVEVKPGSQWKLYHIEPAVRSPLSIAIHHRTEFELAKEGEILVAINHWGNGNVA